MATTIPSQLGTLNSTYLASVPSALLGNQTTTTGNDYSFAYGNYTSGISVLANRYQDVADTLQTTTSTSILLNGTTPNIYVFNTKQDNSSPEFNPLNIGLPSATTQNNTIGSFKYNARTPQPANDSVNFTDNTLQITTDINCMELFFVDSRGGMMPKRSGISSIPTGFFCLQALYAWYSLLDNFTWQIYSRSVPVGTQATSVDIYVPDIITGSGKNNITYTKVTFKNNGTGMPTVSGGATGANAGQLMSQSLIASGNTLSGLADLGALMDYYIPFHNLVDSNGPTINFNPFVARRIIHLHIMSFHWNLAVRYYTGQTKETNPLINALYSLLNSANSNVTNSSGGGILSKITTGIKTRSEVYYSDQNTLNDLNSSSSEKPNSVPNLQTSVNQYNNKLSQTLQYENTIKKYKTAGIAVLVVIAGSVGGLYMLPIDPYKKMIYCGMLIILAVATAFSLQYLLSKTLATEGFTLGQITSTSDVEILSAYNLLYADEAITYLQNTFTLTATLDSYHLYGDASYALNNQVSYYTDAQTSLSMKSQNLKDVNNLSYINQIVSSATINFCVAVSLILSIGATLYFSSENYPTLRSVIVYISALLLFIAVVIFTLELNSRVHTHPKQIYWGADTRALNNSA